MQFLIIAFTIVAAAGVAITSLQSILTYVFRRRRRFFDFPQAGSLVSILKPVCGLDDELEENLESFAQLRGVSYEMIVSIADSNDPAIAIVERVQERHPHLDWRIVIGGDPRLEHGNRKVARLIAAQREARGAILFISDSNVRIQPDDIANTIGELESDPRIGCVSNLFTGARAASFGATIESLHLLRLVDAGNVLAAVGHVPCVVGKSMGISRRALEALGGFAPFANALAEDEPIGLAVRD